MEFTPPVTMYIYALFISVALPFVFVTNSWSSPQQSNEGCKTIQIAYEPGSWSFTVSSVAVLLSALSYVSPFWLSHFRHFPFPVSHFFVPRSWFYQFPEITKLKLIAWIDISSWHHTQSTWNLISQCRYFMKTNVVMPWWAEPRGIQYSRCVCVCVCVSAENIPNKDVLWVR